MRTTKAKYLLASTLASFGLCWAMPAFAAQPAAQPKPSEESAATEAQEEPTGPEIVVTAQFREQEILDVPMSITALSGDTLTRQGATTLIEIASRVPGLSTIEFSPGQNRVQLRGISSLQGRPTVGSYLDELPLNVDGGFANYGADVRFIDMERIEVLRGPQGTLYGEGSMGGTIRYLTRNPNLMRPSVGFEAVAGFVEDGSELYRGNAILNLPLVEDKFGLRFVGGYERSPGWIDYPFLTGGPKKDQNYGDSFTGRLKALWKVTDNFTASLMLGYQDTTQHANNLSDVGTYTSPNVLPSLYHDEMKLGSFVLNYDAGSFNIISATGYLDRTSDQTLDFTQVLGPLYLLFFGHVVDKVNARGVFKFENITQEIRFSSKGDGPFNWSAGVYLKRENRTGFNETITTPTPPLGEFLIPTPQSSHAEAGAVFAEINYAFSPQFDVTAGLRYERERRWSEATATSPEIGGTHESLNPRGVLSYRPTDDILIYATAAKGYRAGGTNALDPTAICPVPKNFKPEQLWSYELGSNVSMADGKVSVQAAVFHNDWTDIHSAYYCPGEFGPRTANGGKVKGSGVDLLLTVRPVEKLSLIFSGSYNHSEYKDTSITHFAGDPVDFVPKWTFSIAGDYDVPVSESLTARLHADYQWVDRFTIAIRNISTIPGIPGGFATSDQVGRINLRASLLKGDWEAFVFANNVTDERKIALPRYGGYFQTTNTQPRTIGFGLRYNY